MNSTHRLIALTAVALLLSPFGVAAKGKKTKRPPVIEQTIASAHNEETGDPDKPRPATARPKPSKKTPGIESNDNGGDATTAPGASGSFGPPLELSLKRAGRAKVDLRRLPFVPQLVIERPELPEPAPNPRAIVVGQSVMPPANISTLAIPRKSVPNAPAPPPSIQFDGLDFATWGAGHPPDTNGDVGPNYYIHTVNTSIGIYDKSTGTRVAAFTFNTFMSQGNFGNLCDTNNFGDPVVLYDTFEDRWIITDFAFVLSGGNVVSPAFQCFGVSMNGDPVNGGWNFYSINSTTALGDYPKFGVWNDGIYMSANQFTFGAGSAFISPRVWAFNKAQMYAGSPSVQVVSFAAPSADFTLLPSNARLQSGTPPAGTPNYFLSTWEFTNALTVYKFHVDWNSISLSTFTGPDTPLAATAWPNAAVANAPSLGGNALDVLQIRAMMQNQYTNYGGTESLWATHTVRRLNATGFAAPRWYQVNVTGGTVNPNLPQAATWDPDGANVTNRFVPSLALDRAGNMALGYSTSDSTTKPAIKYAGRLAGDPVNTFSQGEQLLIQGTGTQTGSCGGTCTRWGDYSAMTLDPDGCTFWFTTEYYAVDGLNDLTRIGAFKYPSCTNVGAGGTVSGTVTATAGGAPISGATVNLGSRTTTTNGSGFYSFSVPAGTYPAMAASAPGFITATASNIVVTDGNTTTQNFSLGTAPTSGCPVDTTQADFQAGVASASIDLISSPGDVTLSNAPVVDQSNTAGTTTGTGFGTPNWTGQTFIAGVTGSLLKVDVPLFCANGASPCTGPAGNLTLSLRNTSAGLPTGADLATATIPGFTSNAGGTFTATFGAPPTLTAGTQYALILRPVSNPAVGSYFWIRSSPSTYANGSRVLSADSGATWSADTTRDFNFINYMQIGYAPAGNFVSSAKDANPAPGITPIWQTLSWTASTPANTGLQFQAAASNSAGGPFNFVGPDGTAGTFFTTSGAALGQFYGFRYLKYQAFLTSSNNAVTPALNDVTVCFTDLDCSAPATITPTPAAVCDSSTGNTATGPAGATSYAWSITNGSITGGQTSQTVTYTAGSSGSVTLNLTVIMPSGCHLSGSANVTINPIPPTPTITPSGPTTFCAGGSVTLTSSAASGNQWYLNGNPIGGATNTTYIANASGNYTVTATASGCTSLPSAATSVTVNPLPAAPTITPGGPTTFCAGGSVTLTSSAASGNQWLLNGNPIGGATNTTYVATASGSYTVTTTDGNGCTSAASAATVVTVNPIPATPTITPGGPTSFCPGGSVTLTSSSASGNQWYLNGNPIGGATNQSYIANATGGYTVVVTASGCSSNPSATTTVTVNPNPNAAITAPGSMMSTTSSTASVANAGVGATYAWSITNGTINSGNGTNSINFTAGSVGTLTLQVTVTTAAGCSDTKSANVTVTVFLAPVTVTSVAPASGTYLGGTAVTINGTGFLNGATVTFGGSAATNVVFFSSTKLTAKTPAHVAGPVNVVVTNTNTSSGTLINGYTYSHTFDANGDSAVDPSDIFYLIKYLYDTGPAPSGAAGMLSGDANNDGVVDPADIFYLVNYLFLGGPAPAARITPAAMAEPFGGTLSLGTPVVRGGRTYIPVILTLADGATTPQAVALEIDFDRAVRNLSMHRIGAAKDATSLFEVNRPSARSISYLVSFNQQAGGLALAAGAQTIAEIELSGPASLGARFDPALTALTDAAGVRAASVSRGNLKLSNISAGDDSHPSPKGSRNE